MAKHMDLYTDCPECESRGYDTDTRICKRCIGTTFIPVRVKALEWSKTVFEDVDFYSAGYFSVYRIKDGEWIACHKKKILGVKFPSLEAAQAACKDYHEHMVMAMLEVVP